MSYENLLYAMAFFLIPAGVVLIVIIATLVVKAASAEVAEDQRLHDNDNLE